MTLSTMQSLVSRYDTSQHSVSFCCSAMTHTFLEGGGDFLDKIGTKTAVVCHDAGAANIIQAWISSADGHDWQPFMAGPASKSWKSLQSKIINRSSIEAALDEATVLLSGTGWETDIEHQARKIARNKGIYNIAVLDHWVNYPDRFVFEGKAVLPDEIFVTDKYAMREAEKCFPGLPVSLYENFYLRDQLSSLRQVETMADDVLYLLEPIRADWPQRAPGEFEALEYFVEHRGVLKIPAETTLRLRPHPSEPQGKYDDWISRHLHLNIEIDTGPLASALSRARWVVGCETYAMIVALAAGKIVISTLPPWASPCRLPHEGIIRLNRMTQI